MKNFSKVFLLVLLSCNQNREVKNTDNRFLLGNWSMCSIQYTGKDGSTSAVTGNACSAIAFGNDLNGYFKRADGEILPFTWNLMGNKLSLKHKGKYEKTALLNTDGIFKVLRVRRKEFIEVDLVDTVENTRYNLLKDSSVLIN